MNEWQEYAERCGFQIADTPLNHALIRLLKRKTTVLNEILLAFLRQEAGYEYRPQIGSGMSFTFDEQVTIKRLEETETISQREFLELLATVDALYSKIYPLGTILELDQELISDNAQEQMPDLDYCYVSVVGQRAIAGDEYVDYIAVLYPNGARGDEPVRLATT